MKRFFAILLTAVLVLSMIPSASLAAQYATVVGGWLRLRAEASFEADTITSYYTGTQVEILSQSGNWYRVKAPDGRRGFMYGDFLKLNTTTPKPESGETAYVTSHNGYGVRLRQGPGTAYRAIGKYDVGTPVTVLQRGTAWCKIRIGDTVGFMMSQFLSSTTSSGSTAVIGYATIWSRNGYGVRLRTGPGTSYDKIGVYSVGTSVAILEKGAEWDRIRVGSRIGWMKNEFLSYHGLNELSSISLNTLSPIVGTFMSVQAVTPAKATMNYQWLVDGKIQGTASTYTVSAQDVGKTIQLRATGTGNYTGTVFSAVTARVISNQQVNGVKLNTIAPVVGNTLSAEVSPSNASVSYLWKVGGAQVSTLKSYTVVASDIGKVVQLTVTGIDGYIGSASAATSPVTAAAYVTDVSIRNVSNSQSGAVPCVGNQLAASVTPEQATVSYQWLRDGNAISGATSASYTLTSSDEGKRISVQVKGTGAYGGEKTSSATEKVAPKPVKPVIDGISLPGVIVGEKYSTRLTAQGGSVTWQLTSGSSLPDGLTLGADGSISGKPTRSGTFTFSVTASNGAGTSEARSFTIVVAPVAAPSLVVGNVVLPTAKVGYAQPAPVSITITNSGNSAATLSNVYTDNSSLFIVNQDGTTSIAAGAADTSWTVQPAAGLAQGSYSANLYVVYDNGAVASSTVQFTVEAAPAEPQPEPKPESKPLLGMTVDAIVTLEEGYAQTTAACINLTNSGNADATITAVASSSASFVINSDGSTRIPSGVTDSSWNVQPALGLTAGTHSATITVSYDNGASVTANVSFVVTPKPAQTYALKVNGAVYGTYEAGTRVTVNAPAAESGKVFDKWSASGVTLTDDTAAQIVIEMPAGEVELTAAYKEAQAPTYSVALNGSVFGAFTAGTEVRITAPEVSGQVFSVWEASGVVLDNPSSAEISFLMPSGDVALTAKYQKLYTVTVNGSVEKTCVKGTQVTVTAAAADTGKAFDGWDVSGISVDASAGQLVFEMPEGDVMLTAKYRYIDYTVTVDQAAHGIFHYGDSVTVEAGDQYGKNFTGWTANVNELNGATSQILSFSMPACNVELSSNYADVVAVELGSSQITWSTDGKSVSWTQVPNASGYYCYREKADGSTTTPETFDASTLSYTFVKSGKDGDVFYVTALGDGVYYSDGPKSSARYTAPSSTVHVVNGEGGGSYRMGDTVTITATVPSGWDFFGWSSSDVQLDNSSAVEISFIMPDYDVTVTADVREKAPPEITTSSISAKQNEELNAFLNASGEAPFTWEHASGAKPAGVHLNGQGQVFGTPTESGSFTIVMKVIDAYGRSDTGEIRIEVEAALMSVENEPDPIQDNNDDIGGDIPDDQQEQQPPAGDGEGGDTPDEGGDTPDAGGDTPPEGGETI